MMSYYIHVRERAGNDYEKSNYIFAVRFFPSEKFSDEAILTAKHINLFFHSLLFLILLDFILNLTHTFN